MTKAQARELSIIRRGGYSEISGRIAGHGMNDDGTMWVTMRGRGWSSALRISPAGEIDHVG